MGVMQEVAEALQACQATDPNERPPLPALPYKLMRLSIVEGDGETVGTATSLLEDGLRIKQVMISTSSTASSLRERVTADGRYQCMFTECMKMQEKGATPFARCASCRIARYCSPECQKEAWGKGHKRICKKYKEVLDARNTRKEGKEAEGLNKK